MAIKRLYGESDDTYNKRSSMTGYTYADSAAKEAAKNAYMNRDKFKYDLGTDMNYQQAKEQYQALGKLAMQDTMGKAASLTGGYGNSYATSAGQQAYNSYLTQLNQSIPDYYAMALDAYTREGEDLLNKYSIYDAEDQQGYSRYMDTYNNLLNLAQMENSDAVSQRDFDEQVRQYNESMKYQKERDKVADNQWQQEYKLSLTAAQNPSKDSASYLEPTSDMYSKALYLKIADEINGTKELDKYLSGLSEYNIEAIDDYATTHTASQNWGVESYGDLNWGGGIDKNASLKDYNGTKYNMKDFYDGLISAGVDKDKAKKYVMELQNSTGLSTSKYK